MSPQTFVFFGIVGSGKGTQVRLLMNFLKNNDSTECVYIGTGEIFRKISSSASDSDSSKVAIKEMLLTGKLMPDKNTNDLVWEELGKNEPLEGKSITFDGYPRTVTQAEEFEKMMEKYQRKAIKVVHIELSEEEAMKRNLLRGRDDDTEEGLRKRFEEYKNNVIPAINYFKNKAGYTIYTINGEQSIENVQKDIIRALGF
jgi:adenylate kinase